MKAKDITKDMIVNLHIGATTRSKTHGQPYVVTHPPADRHGTVTIRPLNSDTKYTVHYKRLSKCSA